MITYLGLTPDHRPSYNALNQPIAVWSPSLGPTNFMWFGFDPLGRCVKRWISTTGTNPNEPATYLYYDGWNLIQEGPSASQPTMNYVHGARVDELVAAHRLPWAGDAAFFHYDARGHCSHITDFAGNIREQYEYDAFGKPYVFNQWGQPLGDSSPWGNRFLFTGREWLKELRLYDYRHRLYHPELGRFMQPDPKQFEAGDYNLYRYCHNDPVNRSDPFGLLTIIIPGFGPGQKEDPNGKWSNQYFIEKAKATDPRNYRVFGRDQKGAMMEAIAKARARGDNTLNVFGYSRGAVAAVQLARNLAKAGIGVDRLVSLDPIRLPTDSSRSFSVPGNVKNAHNYYQSGGFAGFPSMRLTGHVQNHPEFTAGTTTPNDIEVRHQSMPQVLAGIPGGY